MALNPLSPAAILERMARSLPTHAKDDTTSDLSSSLEAIALFTHACMMNLDFRLLGFDQDKNIEAECTRLAPRLPSKWNSANGVSSVGFVYAHSQDSMKFVIKADRLGSKVEVRGLAIEDEQIRRIEVVARDYVSNTALPVRITMKEEGEDRGDLAEKLGRVLISEERMSDLASLLKLKIIQRLTPKLQKQGYQDEEDPDDRVARQDADAVYRSGARNLPPVRPEGNGPDPVRPHPYPAIGPLAAPVRQPAPYADFPAPDFEDEYDMNRPLRLMSAAESRSPLNIGHDDLHPPGLAPYDPLRGSFVPGSAPGGFGGMHPTFDDPLFRGPGRGQGPGSNPQAPDGARWDPVRPDGGPRLGIGRGGGGFLGEFGGDIM